jgi:4-oxalocrotonate tautomerase
MPHVIVKLWPGKSERQKTRLADKIAKDVMDVLNYGEESVSVGFEEISSKHWKEKVYKPDITDKWDKLYKKPGYEM